MNELKYFSVCHYFLIMAECGDVLSETGGWQRKPICLLVLGMAGSGKTSLVRRLATHLHSKKQPPYIVNLDPAVREVPYPANIGELLAIM